MTKSVSPIDIGTELFLPVLGYEPKVVKCRYVSPHPSGSDHSLVAWINGSAGVKTVHNNSIYHTWLEAARYVIAEHDKRTEVGK